MLAVSDLKFCPSCETKKLLSEFGKSKHRPDGLTVYCKKCRNRKARESYNSDPELRARKYQKIRERYESDPTAHEGQLKRQRRWYREHYADPSYRASENERHRRSWHASERRRTMKLTSNKRYQRRRYAEDAEFRERLLSHSKRYQHTRRASGGSYTKHEWEMLLDLCGNRCIACGAVTKLEVDHIIPVSSGGTNDIGNLQPLCRSCNAGKGQTVADYRSDEVASIIEARCI
jgi:5-methylcytosine-specific restriction endonuclease McrA